MPSANSTRAGNRTPLSARKQLVLSTLAEEDYEDIKVYTVMAWGAAQWAAYETALVRALESLAENPEIGRARDDLRLGAARRWCANT